MASSPQIGQTLGHYRIIERIGAGGMGVVYRAHDERLDRNVALKVLPTGTLADDGARKRFRKEALALARLNHPHIRAIYDFDTQDGLDFLVMEYVPGGTLASRLTGGALSEKEVAALGTQIAAALEEAHELGIVHRDLKPGNIALTLKGQAKVLDFGLAKLFQPTSAGMPGESLTASVADAEVAGTLPYMAPEQVEGERVDARADIYSLGAVLYEMAIGRRPFHADSVLRLSDAIRHQPPVSPRAVNAAVSPELERIILKCLEKDPENRYQSAKELCVDLRRLTMPSSVTTATAAPAPRGWLRAVLPAGYGAAGLLVLVAVLVALNVGGWRDRLLGRSASPRIESLAVLPLENLSRDPDQEYFADGMTEALITDLSKISALKVISRTSVMRYKGVKKPLPQIAGELKVDAVIEGSVQRSGNRVRITAQLIQAATDRHLWAESYERDLSNVLALESEVAQAIASEIKIKLTPQEHLRLTNTRSVDPEAHRLYLMGLYYWNKRSAKDLRTAIEFLEKAIAQDPTYAPAYAGLADCYAVMVIHSDVRPREFFPKAIAAANKALEIDATLAGPHAALAWTKDQYEWDWAGAEREYKHALELNPNYATAHQWYALHFAILGRIEEGITEMKRAQELDPLSLIINTNLGQLFNLARRYDNAIEQYRKTLDMDPNFVHAHYCLGAVYREQGRYEEAIAECKKAVELSGGSTLRLSGLGSAYGRAGKRTEALKIIQQLRELAAQTYVDPTRMALAYAGLREKDQVLAWLEKAYKERSLTQIFLKKDPGFDPFRSDPRFQDLLRRIGLPP